jgi:phosphate acetyltransferase
MVESLHERLIAKGAKTHTGSPRPRVLLTEGEDPRIQHAAGTLSALGWVSVSLVGTGSLPSVQYLSPGSFSGINALSARLYDRRKHKGMSRDESEKLMNDPLYFGASLLATGEVDVAVSGAVHTTGDVIRAGVHCLDKQPGINTISSFFAMTLANGKTVTYADCGVVPYPTAEELSEIAISSARAHKLLTDEEPHVALLSFSTLGSAEHERVSLLRDALTLIKSKNPQLSVDGELQFDAAFVPEVAARKAPHSSVAGHANVFIFPNLDAGNIAYKITERIGGARATGPILQGFKHPWLDLSRGCSADDIVRAAIIGISLMESK